MYETMWRAHIRSDSFIPNIRSVVTGYDCGLDVSYDPHQGYQRFELRLEPKGICTARLTIDFIVSFRSPTIDIKMQVSHA